MRDSLAGWGLGRLTLVATLVAASAWSYAQNGPGETKGLDAGNYNIQQSIEAGYRSTWINGNTDTYDTFVNLGDGLRLFDYTLD
ncbi:MAG: hypothetical protein WBX03_05385, partial [Terriglobales bacterium]